MRTAFFNIKHPLGITQVAFNKILCNNIRLPIDGNSQTKLYVIGNQFGAIGAVWASCEGDAIDELIDRDMAGGILISEDRATDNTPRGGNDSQPYDDEYTWIAEVEFNPVRDWDILLLFAEARGAGHETLYDGSTRALPVNGSTPIPPDPYTEIKECLLRRGYGLDAAAGAVNQTTEAIFWHAYKLGMGIESL